MDICCQCCDPRRVDVDLFYCTYVQLHYLVKHYVSKKAINDKLQGSVTTCLSCGGVVNNQIMKGLLLSPWVKKLKSVNFGKLQART